MSMKTMSSTIMYRYNIDSRSSSTNILQISDAVNAHHEWTVYKWNSIQHDHMYEQFKDHKQRSLAT